MLKTVAAGTTHGSVVVNIEFGDWPSTRFYTLSGLTWPDHRLAVDVEWIHGITVYQEQEDFIATGIVIVGAWQHLVSM